MTADPEMISPAEAARRLNVTRQRVGQLTRTGRLPTVRVGNRLAIPARSVERYDKERRLARGGRPVIPPGWATPKQIAEQLDILEVAVWQWVDADEVEHRQPGAGAACIVQIDSARARHKRRRA